MEGKATRLCSLRGMDLLDVESLSEALLPPVQGSFCSFITYRVSVGCYCCIKLFYQSCA